MIFNSIPNALRVPFTYVEFSNSEASGGSTVQPYKLLLIGQKLAAGTAPALTPVRIQSIQQAKTLFGGGSMLARMCEKSILANNFTETWALPVADDAAGVAATSTLTITGTASADGTLSIYVGGQLVSVAVLSGDAPADIAADLAAAITGNAELPFTAAAAAGVVTLTSRHKGASFNGFPVIANYNGEEFPVGVSVAVSATAGGTTDPAMGPVISAMGDQQFRTIVMPYTSAAALTAFEEEMARRWGPLLVNDGHVFTATNASSSAAITLGLSRNSPHLTILSNAGSPTPSYEAAAVLGAVVAFNSPINQARPLQTLPLPGVLAPPMADQLLLAERNVLLYSGVATTQVDAGGVVRLERVITTFKEDAVGNPDESYLDYETLATLSYLRFDFRATFARKYPRHKLASDDARLAPGAAVMTPTGAKTEAVGLFINWEEMGLVENRAQFMRDLRVEINPLNPNRLDFYLPPNLINGLRVIAAQIAFRS